jgi:anti-sigma-K factor RskA
LENALNCQDFADDILLHAAGALEPEEVEPLLDHLAGGCPRCAGRLTEAKSLLGLLVLTLPPATPSEQSRRELLKRLAAPNRRMTVPAPAPAPTPVVSIPKIETRPVTTSPSWWAQLAVPSAIAATIAAIITIFFALRLENNRAADGAALAADLQRTLGVVTSLATQQQAQLDAMKNSVAVAQMPEWTADAHVRTFALSGTPNQPAEATGRIVWDRDKGLWYLYAHGLRPAPDGKTYELWFVSSDTKTKLPAGSFDPSPTGDASLVAKIPPEIADKLAIGAVTDEPAGGKIVVPTGSFQLEGEIAQ